MPPSPFDAALRFLALREHSEAEIVRKLKGKKFPEEEIREAVSRLKGLGYLDDLRFARLFAESALRGGRFVGNRLFQELKLRGVPEGVARQVAQELAEEYPVEDTLCALIARRFSGFDPETATDKERRRVVGYLIRRGFSFSDIQRELRLKSI